MCRFDIHLHTNIYCKCNATSDAPIISRISEIGLSVTFSVFSQHQQSVKILADLVMGGIENFLYRLLKDKIPQYHSIVPHSNFYNINFYGEIYTL